MNSKGKKTGMTEDAVEVNNKQFKSNIIGLDENQTIYRIYKYEHLIDLLVRKRNTLVKPEKWNDPFENLLYKTPYPTKKGALLPLPGKERHFGQCWTLKEESYAMWQIYSPCKTGIKVKTTVSKIFNPINEFCERRKQAQKSKIKEFFGTPEQFQVIIGKVEYLKEKELLFRLQDRVQYKDTVFDDSGLKLLKSFLVKRIPFDYEEEVRIIYHHFQEPSEKDSTFSYNIDPNEVIEEIILDPRADDSFVELASQQISNFGYKNEIRKSTLYDKPDLVFDFHDRTAE